MRQDGRLERAVLTPDAGHRAGSVIVAPLQPNLHDHASLPTHDALQNTAVLQLIWGDLSCLARLLDPPAAD